MSTYRSPVGWGIGIPVGDALKGVGAKSAAARIQRVLDATGADWYQTWLAESVNGADSRFVPASEAGNCTSEMLRAAIGGCLLLLNEPERGWWPPIKTPTKAADVTVQQLHALDELRGPYHWAAPNCNVNGANLEWLQAYAAALWQRGGRMPSYWAIHLYGADTAQINYHWQRFLRWHARLGGGRQIVVSEFGPGPGASLAQQLAVMEFGARLLQDALVLGVAFFAAGTAYQGHPDVCADPALLARFRELGRGA